MAKLKPTLTLMEMEDEMGYKVDALDRPDEAEKRFYSDLTPVPDNTYGLTEKDYQEFVKRKHDKNSGKAADICYGVGFNLPLLLTEAEVVRTFSVAKLLRETTPSVNRGFFDLPREIRDKIYIFAIPRGEWRITNIDKFEQDNLIRGIGDPSGFYYPLSKSLVVLRVNKQMRLEALPFAYRRTTFIWDDLDDVIKFLVAIGQVGRDNIESLQFPWESRTDMEFTWEGFLDSELPWRLPVLHASECVQLLRRCKRLKHLRLCFEEDLILSMQPDAFMADSGIGELCSIQGITQLEIWDLGNSSLEHCRIAKLLREKIEGAKEEETGHESIYSLIFKYIKRLGAVS
ncbi:uncharacterized protein B0H64DRAFT_374433 [Chaetomium fimeti]|uniref:Uncharacterized protein n=1 Tax=Chaetomium fimeti TaxID=1854472 RepID=A0AAE0HH28_9PEZI|nr:hypothetical protein B0H64DRAFT_374433 [Chaetomium fimeti]